MRGLINHCCLPCLYAAAGRCANAYNSNANDRVLQVMAKLLMFSKIYTPIRAAMLI